MPVSVICQVGTKKTTGTFGFGGKDGCFSPDAKNRIPTFGRRNGIFTVRWMLLKFLPFFRMHPKTTTYTHQPTILC
jgi:hypothetical protein